MTVTKGHCQCRAIEYEFDGQPKWVMHCHCENCRRAVSSAVATYVGVRLQQFRYLKGEPTAYDSSPGVQRFFQQSRLGATAQSRSLAHAITECRSRIPPLRVGFRDDGWEHPLRFSARCSSRSPRALRGR